MLRSKHKDEDKLINSVKRLYRFALSSKLHQLHSQIEQSINKTLQN